MFGLEDMLAAARLTCFVYPRLSVYRLNAGLVSIIMFGALTSCNIVIGACPGSEHSSVALA